MRLAANRGFTLVELALAVALVALVAALAARRFAGVREKARAAAAAHDMRLLRDALAGGAAAPGYLEDMERVPGFSPGFLRVADLLTPTNRFAWGGVRADAAASAWNPEARRGWRGPYARIDRPGPGGESLFPAPSDRPRGRDGATFAERGFFPALERLSVPAEWRERRAAYGFPGEPALYDPWGAPYVLQIPPPQAFSDGAGRLADVPDEERFRYARIVSAGPDGVLSAPCYFSNTNETGSAWSAERRRASIFAGLPAERGDDLVLFVMRSDIYHPGYEREGDAR